MGNVQNITLHQNEVTKISKHAIEGVDAVIISSLSINLFPDEELDVTLEWIDRVLPVGGHLIFGCFDESALASFERYDGKIGKGYFIESYKDDCAMERLMHSFIVYKPERELLIQNWFVDMQGTDNLKRHCISAQIERLWTRSSLKPYLESWGFVPEVDVPFSVNGGGAHGQTAHICRYRKTG